MEPVLTLYVRRAHPAEGDQLAAVAAQTFPLACPPSCTPDDVAAFIAENLTAARFADYLADPAREVLTATDEPEHRRIVGYAMTVAGEPGDASVAAAIPRRPAVELSKLYVLPECHGSGAAAALLMQVVDRAAAAGAACVWLGVNQRNERAQRFYTKNGFAITGTKTFRLGVHVEDDYVMVRPV